MLTITLRSPVYVELLLSALTGKMLPKFVRLHTVRPHHKVFAQEPPDKERGDSAIEIQEIEMAYYPGFQVFAGTSPDGANLFIVDPRSMDESEVLESGCGVTCAALNRAFYQLVYS